MEKRRKGIIVGRSLKKRVFQLFLGVQIKGSQKRKTNSVKRRQIPHYFRIIFKNKILVIKIKY
jgi:hypothetical protein